MANAVDPLLVAGTAKEPQWAVVNGLEIDSHSTKLVDLIENRYMQIPDNGQRIVAQKKKNWINVYVWNKIKIIVLTICKEAHFSVFHSLSRCLFRVHALARPLCVSAFYLRCKFRSIWKLRCGIPVSFLSFHLWISIRRSTDQTKRKKKKNKYRSQSSVCALCVSWAHRTQHITQSTLSFATNNLDAGQLFVM